MMIGKRRCPQHRSQTIALSGFDLSRTFLIGHTDTGRIRNSRLDLRQHISPCHRILSFGHQSTMLQMQTRNNPHQHRHAQQSHSKRLPCFASRGHLIYRQSEASGGRQSADVGTGIKEPQQSRGLTIPLATMYPFRTRDGYLTVCTQRFIIGSLDSVHFLFALRRCIFMSVEHVLVIPTPVFHQVGHFQGFSDEIEKYLEVILDPQHASYRPRPEMEQDPSFKQLIPYCVFRCNGEVFYYQRGTAQGKRDCMPSGRWASVVTCRRWI